MPSADEVAAAVIQAMQSKDGVLAGPQNAASVMDGTNPTWTVAGFLRDASYQARTIETRLAEMDDKIDNLTALLQQATGTGPAPK